LRHWRVQVWFIRQAGALFGPLVCLPPDVFSGFLFCDDVGVGGVNVLSSIALTYSSKVRNSKWRNNWDGAFDLVYAVHLHFGVGLVTVTRAVRFEFDPYFGRFK